jgi:hypothetical protein
MKNRHVIPIPHAGEELLLFVFDKKQPATAGLFH